MSTPVLARCAQKLKVRPPETPLLETLPKEAFTREMPFLNKKKKNSSEALLHSSTDEIDSSFGGTLKFKAD